MWVTQTVLPQPSCCNRGARVFPFSLSPQLAPFSLATSLPSKDLLDLLAVLGMCAVARGSIPRIRITFLYFFFPLPSCWNAGCPSFSSPSIAYLPTHSNLAAHLLHSSMKARGSNFVLDASGRQRWRWLYCKLISPFFSGSPGRRYPYVALKGGHSLHPQSMVDVAVLYNNVVLLNAVVSTYRKNAAHSR